MLDHQTSRRSEAILSSSISKKPPQPPPQIRLPQPNESVYNNNECNNKLLIMKNPSFNYNNSNDNDKNLKCKPIYQNRDDVKNQHYYDNILKLLFHEKTNETNKLKNINDKQISRFTLILTTIFLSISITIVTSTSFSAAAAATTSSTTPTTIQSIPNANQKHHHHHQMRLFTSAGQQQRDLNQYKTVYACENNKLELSCANEGKLIHLVRATYGRFSLSMCNEHGHSNLSVQCVQFRAFLIMQPM